MRKLLEKLRIEKISDSERAYNRLIIMFLVLAITLPAYIIYLGFPYLKPSQEVALCQGKVVSLYICSIILLILCDLKYYKYRGREKKYPIKPMLPVIFFLIAVWISTVLSPYMDNALWGHVEFKEGAFTLTCYCIIFFASYIMIRTEPDSIRIIHTILIVAAILYLIPLLKILLPYIPSAPINRGGTFLHRNYISSYYTLVFIPAVAGYFYSKSKKAITIFYLLSCIFFSIFILNHTRSAWVGNIIGLILFIFLGRRFINLKKLGALIIAFIFIVIIIDTINNGLILARFNSMVNDAKVLAENGTDKSFVGTNRYGIWQLGLEQVPENFWFGAGPDMFGRVFPQGEYREKIDDLFAYVANAHNEYLNLMINIGIFGLLSYLWLVVSILRKYIKCFGKSVTEGYSSILILGVFCGWCAYLVQAFFNNSVVPTSPTLWAIMGMLCAIPCDS